MIFLCIIVLLFAFIEQVAERIENITSAVPNGEVDIDFYNKIKKETGCYRILKIMTEWRIIMTSKQRTELKSQAMKLDSIFQIGKSSLTPQSIEAIRAALKARELIKINVLKNCDDDTNELAKLIAERTGAEVVQVIGKKIILYKQNMQKLEKRRLAEKRAEKKKEAAKRKAKEIKRGTKSEWTRADSMRKKNQVKKNK